MLRTLRVALITALAILLSASLLSATPRAEASPRPASPDAISRPGVSLTPTQWKAAKKARDARNKAITPGGTKMDYRKMKSVFGTKNKTQVDWRRQMAAGFRQAGGKITHISKAENKLVEKRRKQIYGKKKPRALSATNGVQAFASCKGRSGTVVKGNNTWQYLNSCEVIDLLYAWGGCVAAMGALGFVAGNEKRVAWPAYAIGAFCGYHASNIQKAREKSDNGSIYVKTYKAEAYQPYPGQVKYYIRTTVHPQ